MSQTEITVRATLRRRYRTWELETRVADERSQTREVTSREALRVAKRLGGDVEDAVRTIIADLAVVAREDAAAEQRRVQEAVASAQERATSAVVRERHMLADAEALLGADWETHGTEARDAAG